MGQLTMCGTWAEAPWSVGCYSRGAGFHSGGFSTLSLPPPLARFVNTSTRPRPSRANPWWRPHHEFRFFRPSNLLHVGNSWKNKPHLKNVSKLNKWVTLKTLCPSGKNGSQRKYVAQLEKWITLINKGHTWSPLKNVSHLKEWVILKKCVTVGKWVILKKKLSPFKKWSAVGKRHMSHT